MQNTRSPGALRALTSIWRPFVPLTLRLCDPRPHPSDKQAHCSCPFNGVKGDLGREEGGEEGKGREGTKRRNEEKGRKLLFRLFLLKWSNSFLLHNLSDSPSETQLKPW